MPMTPSVMQARADFKKQKARENLIATAGLAMAFVLVGCGVFAMLTGGFFPNVSLPTSFAALLTAVVVFAPFAIFFAWACWRVFATRPGR